MRHIGLCTLVVLLLSTAAMADVFTFSYSSTSISMSGTLEASNAGSGAYLATSGAGTMYYNADPSTTYSLQLLTPPDLGGVRFCCGDVVTTDNLIFPSTPDMVLDYVGGIAFTLTGHQFSEGVYLSLNNPGTPNVYYDFTDLAPAGNRADIADFDGQMSVQAAVPEPSAVFLMLTTLACLAGAFRKKLV